MEHPRDSFGESSNCEHDRQAYQQNGQGSQKGYPGCAGE